MQGKRVLVTGAGTGIGRGVALEFAKEGAAVAVHYGRDRAGAVSAVEAIASHGGKAKAFEADFRDAKTLRALAQDVTAFLGGLDVLVNNAGITLNVPFEEVTLEQFDTLYHVNIRAQFFLTQALLPALAEHGKGIVINLTSVHAYGGMTEHSVYAGTKGAIVAYTRELSLELVQRGVRVNAIAPGWVFVENHRGSVGRLGPGSLVPRFRRVPLHHWPNHHLRRRPDLHPAIDRGLSRAQKRTLGGELRRGKIAHGLGINYPTA
jgi:glucose 1-dehydrogenase/3-oxoacyl-[acyl-carrier protein] reductase